MPKSFERVGTKNLIIMKKIILILSLGVFSLKIFSQNTAWTTNANAIGLGTASPVTLLHINSNGTNGPSSSYINMRLEKFLTGGSANQNNTVDFLFTGNPGGAGFSAGAGSFSLRMGNPNGTADMIFMQNPTTPGLVLKSTGKIGIGTVNPSDKLSILGGGLAWGNTAFSNQLTYDQGGSMELGAMNNAVNPANGTPYIDFHFGNTSQDYNVRVINSANNQLDFNAPISSGILLTLQGNAQGNKVGIGTISPGAALEVKSIGGASSFGIISRTSNSLCKAFSVFDQSGAENFLVYGNGTLFAREIWVKVGTLGDFVFEPEYKRMSLYDLENFVKTKKHLPNIPTEAEVQENNMNMGEMQALQLQKIEELTLYIIELQKQIDALKVESNKSKK
jgi:hypothetical protein